MKNNNKNYFIMLNITYLIVYNSLVRKTKRTVYNIGKTLHEMIDQHSHDIIKIA